MNVSRIDKNFDIKTNIDKKDLKFYDARQTPFKIYGVFYEGGQFRRMPDAVAKTVSEGVYSLHGYSSGGRVRFRTNSPCIAISARLKSVDRMSHSTFTALAGFDLYENDEYARTFIPPYNMKDGYESLCDLGNNKMRDITINFPTFCELCELYIGLDEGAKLSEPTPYKIEKPILYYGSSITQGGCVSRPGNAYEARISRELSADFINLGFSGSGKGEKEMSDYIKTLDASVFVYDYDHNAPTPEHLEETHERMFLEYREANPERPIVILSRPKYRLTEIEKRRLEIITRTYENAKRRGDKNVYFIKGRDLMKYAKSDGTVDNIHPNDLGFYSIAKVLSKTLKKILR